MDCVTTPKIHAWHGKFKPRMTIVAEVKEDKQVNKIMIGVGLKNFDTLIIQHVDLTTGNIRKISYEQAPYRALHIMSDEEKFYVIALKT